MYSYSREDFLKVINLINGYMRTNKIAELHIAIEWFNENANSSIPIPLLGKDSSLINWDSWFTGFLTRERAKLDLIIYVLMEDYML